MCLRYTLEAHPPIAKHISAGTSRPACAPLGSGRPTLHVCSCSIPSRYHPHLQPSKLRGVIPTATHLTSFLQPRHLPTRPLHPHMHRAESFRVLSYTFQPYQVIESRTYCTYRCVCGRRWDMTFSRLANGNVPREYVCTSASHERYGRIHRGCRDTAILHLIDLSVSGTNFGVPRLHRIGRSMSSTYFGIPDRLRLI
jgi:hypothetical protein